MQTSDERREVAARLRGLDVKITSRDTLERAVDKFMKAVCGDIPFSPIRYSVRNLCGLANMLADLIDLPTCNMDVMTTDERADYECSEHIMRCLNCGAEFGYVLYSEDGDVSMDDKPNYCPHCGTRVVSDDD